MLKMLQTKCKSNALNAQEDIVKQLEKLNIWQEEQKRLLEERQNLQRKMLGLEQQNMYEKMGIFHARTIIEATGVGAAEESSSDQVKKGGTYENIEFDREVKEIETRLFEGSKKNEVKFSNETDNDNMYCSNEGLHIKDVKIKRPYLKRGEGIKARYKVSPESLRLNNLPRYKYATNHPKIKNLQRRRIAPKVKPSSELGNLITKTPESVEESKLDINEKYFNQMLVNSNNVNSSTPDTKFSKEATPSISNCNLRNVRVENYKTMEGKKCYNAEENLHEHKVGHYVGISWAKFLDPQIVKPIPIQEIRTPVKKCDKMIKTNKNFTEDDENLTIFELLEKQAAIGAIDMNSTCIRNFLEKKSNSEEHQESETDFPTEDIYTGSRLRPAVEQILRIDSDDESTVSVESLDERALPCQTPTISSYVSDESKNEHILNVEKADLHVRFSEQNTTLEFDNREDMISNNSALGDETTLNKSSYLFHQFKDALFSALLGKTDGEDKTTEQNLMMPSPPSALTQELQEKSSIIKLRLEELEKEIADFRNNNLELIRAKQEYEIEKSHFNQERNEALDRLRDDKIQMEMYLHDERMKIEEEKRKFEQQMRVQKQTLNNKERKEVARLKDELESLRIQLKQKEQLHASAQARLRVQIRNMERDQKQLYEDVEKLTRENKRLQSEKQKLEREGNNKMLMEINKNIAKLAPKLAAGNSCSTTIECPEVNTRFSKRTLKSSYSSQTNKKSSNNNQNQMKAPPNTRNTSRTDIKEDVENSSTLYKATMFDRCNDSEGGLADEDDDDDIIAELKVSENSKSTKSAESSSHSNISKDTVIYKCDANSGFVVPNSKSIDENTNNDRNDKKIVKSVTKCGENFRREIINPDGGKDILYPNGNLKKISPDGMNIRMLYFNKDIKETNVNEGTVKYYYAETNTWHTTYLDGLEIFEFPNGQTEHRYKNGVIEIHLPDNSVKITNPADKDKLEEWRFADGTNLIQMHNGDRVLMLPNGQKEIHTKLNKRREYPDGTVKLVYPDGSQETRYSNGRIRLKDKDGNLVMDTERV
uniref:Centromere protein J n=1 Tax=Ceratitis capitata TaxID=7213 RepID=W8BI41_CERCA